jgi:hypothetical protein
LFWRRLRGVMEFESEFVRPSNTLPSKNRETHKLLPNLFPLPDLFLLPNFSPKPILNENSQSNSTRFSFLLPPSPSVYSLSEAVFVHMVSIFSIQMCVNKSLTQNKLRRLLYKARCRRKKQCPRGDTKWSV